MLKQKDVEIEYNGAKHIVTIKRLSDLEAAEYVDRIMVNKINPMTKLMEPVIVSAKKTIVELLRMTIIKAPFEINEKGFNELMDGNLTKLFDEAQEFNQLDLKKKTPSEEV